MYDNLIGTIGSLPGSIRSRARRRGKEDQMSRMLILVFLSLLTVAGGAQAVQPIPDKTGFTGFVALGAGAASVESSFLAEVSGQEASEENIDDLDAPDSETFPLPVAGFELGYVFNGKTQLFAGNLLEDYLRFDLSTRFGVRHSLGDAGRVSLSALQSPIKTRVYENPYVTGVDRDATDRDVTGFRVAWDEILGSGLEIRLSSREIELDDETSGVGLGLTPAQVQSLDRNGDMSSVNLRYAFPKSGNSRVVVGVIGTEADLDGEAMSFDSTTLEINWIYSPSKDLRIVTNVFGGQREFDEANPVFGEKSDTDIRALTLTGFFPGLWGFKEWVPNAAFLYVQEDSDIDFFDSETRLVSVGVFRRF
jgi:hypothetical protein